MDRSYDAKGFCDIEGVLFIPAQVPDLIKNLFEEPPLKPTKLFDNLYFVGTKFVGSLIIKTSDGLIVIDTMNHDKDAENVILPGMIELGLNPADIKHIIITHGHLDHYGAAKYLKNKFGAKVYLSEIDHKFMREVIIPIGDDRVPQGEKADPGIDRHVDEGDKIVCGDTEVTVVFTPGHTPGGISLIFPVKDGKDTHYVGLWGGTKIPDDLLSASQYLTSIEHFIEVCKEKDVDVSVQIHPFVDYNLKKGIYDGKIEERTVGEGHPLVLGKERFQVFLQCIKAAAVGKVEIIKQKK